MQKEKRMSDGELRNKISKSHIVGSFVIVKNWLRNS